MECTTASPIIGFFGSIVPARSRHYGFPRPAAIQHAARTAEEQLRGIWDQSPLRNAQWKGGGGEFEWMTYEEWGRKVDACRTVLKDTCGECRVLAGLVLMERFDSLFLIEHDTSHDAD